MDVTCGDTCVVLCANPAEAALTSKNSCDCGGTATVAGLTAPLLYSKLIVALAVTFGSKFASTRYSWKLAPVSPSAKTQSVLGACAPTTVAATVIGPETFERAVVKYIGRSTTTGWSEFTYIAHCWLMLLACGKVVPRCPGGTTTILVPSTVPPAM